MISRYPGTCTCGAKVPAGSTCTWDAAIKRISGCPACAKHVAAPAAPAGPRLTLDTVGSLFVARTTDREAGATPKAAGFRWHGGDCRPGCLACAAGLGKVWWTADAAMAARLLDSAEAVTDQARAACATAVAQTAASRATDAAVEIPCNIGLAYLPFQRAGIAYVVAAIAAGKKGALIADEMGLGKTIQAIGSLNAQLAKLDDAARAAYRVLVICPASLRTNWKRELERWLVSPLSIEIMDADAAPTAQVVIAGYERARRPAAKAALLATAWDVLIVDEAHRCKDLKSQQAATVLGAPATSKREAIDGLANHAKTVLLLTGTPILAKPVEAQPLLQVLDPQFGGFGYLKRYCNAHKEQVTRSREVWDFSGSSHLDELQAKLRASIMVRRLKSEVLTELPPKRREIVILDRNGSAGAVADELRAFSRFEDEITDAEVEMEVAKASGDEMGYAAAAARLTKIQGIAFTEIAAARAAVAEAKIPHVIEHVDGLLAADTDGKTKALVFVHHHSVGDALAAHYGGTAMVIDGRTPMADRQAAVDRFQTDPGCTVAILSIAAAGVGLTLTAAQTVVFAELDWTPANISQAEDRAHRIGQLGSVLVQHLVFDGSLDSRMVALLVAKQAVADAMLDTKETLTLAPASERSRAAQARTVAESTLPALTDAQRAAAAQAMRIVARMCDGARELDGSGFSKIDVGIGHRLAALATFNDGQARLAARLARKYHRQLPAELLSAL